MSAFQEVMPEKLGIIAGGGQLPAYLISICAHKKIETYVVGFKTQTSPDIMDGPNRMWAGLGCAGKIIGFFKENNVHDLVMIGGIKRPSLTEIKPDWKGIQILARMGIKSLGDNAVLEILKEELEREGFLLRGIHEFCDKLLMKDGAIGKFSPTQEQMNDIHVGIKASQELGLLDIGQAVVVQGGVVLGVEGVEGTDELIKRCGYLKKEGINKPILIKTRKPQQNKNLDLPTIGLDTILNAHNAGFAGIAVHADNVLVVDPKNIELHADKYKMFVTGVRIED